MPPAGPRTQLTDLSRIDFPQSRDSAEEASGACVMACLLRQTDHKASSTRSLLEGSTCSPKETCLLLTGARRNRPFRKKTQQSPVWSR